MKKITLFIITLLLMAGAVAQDLPAKRAEFPGGTGALIQFIQSECQYPKEAQDKKIQGTVLVEFIIDKEGNVTNVNVLKSAHPLLDAEAVRVCRAMPQWTPAQDGEGKYVKSTYQLPFTFEFYDGKKAKKAKKKGKK
jgi:protein TonB